MQNNKNGMVNESAQEGMFIHAYLNSSYAEHPENIPMKSINSEA